MIFFSTLASDFFMLNALNPPLFIRDWSLIRTGIIRTVDLKLSSWTVRFWQLKATWVGLFGEASRPLWCQSAKKNYIGVMLVYSLSDLVGRWSIKCSKNMAIRAAFEWKRKKMMNSNQTTSCLVCPFFFLLFGQNMLFHLNETMSFWILRFNSGILSKFNLVIRLLIYFNYTPNWP